MPYVSRPGALGGSASTDMSGVRFAADVDGSLHTSFLVPPDHDPAADLFVDIVIHEFPLAPVRSYS